MEKLEHIGIAVKNMDQANQLFAQLLGCEPYKTETVESEGVKTSFFEVSGVKIELLEATREDSPIAKFIEKRGEGIHHLAFEVADIEQSIAQYQQKKASTSSIKHPKTVPITKLLLFSIPNQHKACWWSSARRGLNKRLLALRTAVLKRVVVLQLLLPATGLISRLVRGT